MDKYGHWTVIGEPDIEGKVKCKCDCGTVRDVLLSNLKCGDSTCCGCISNKDKLVDLKDQRFGMLTVVNYVKEEKKWLCKCDCGNTVLKRSWDLRNGKGTTCGCKKGGSFKLIDLKDKKCGYLIPKIYIGNHQWECLCECGEMTVKTQTQLKNPNVSCGCKLNKSKLKYAKGDRIGKLVVDKHIPYKGYECVCDCGNKRIVPKGYLGKISECTECTEKRLQDSYNNNRIDLLDKRFGSLLVTGYNQHSHKWICKCDCGKEFEVYGQHLRVGDTRSCGCKFGLDNSNYRSYLEMEICDYIKSIYDGDTINNHRGIINGKEIDIYIPDLKIGIEINGDYWHNSDVVDTMYHQNKVLEAYKHEVRLIHIYEYEWRNNQEVIERFLKSLLCDNKKVAYGRNTYVKEINKDEATDFLNKYHLQGYTGSNIKIGLFTNDILIGVMTFGKPRFDSDCSYEVIRLAFNTEYSVVGGAEKLFKYFINKYKPNSVISYCNIDKFQGNVYSRLGFKTINLGKPNYVWVKSKTGDVLTRYKTQKHKLVELGLGTDEQTEDEIMISLGYTKIYDSGNLKLEWKQNNNLGG